MESSDGEYHSEILILAFSEITFNPVTADVVIAFGVMILLLIGSALVSGSEVAFFSLTQRNIRELQKNLKDTGHVVIHLLEKPRTLLATILIANNLFNIATIIVSYHITSRLLEMDNTLLEFLINAVLITFILVLFGEVIPKVYANYNNVSFARFMARPLGGIKRIFMPLSRLLLTSTRFIEKRVQSQNGDFITREEIHHAIDIASDENTTKEEVNILKGIVKFGNITVKQIMCSRVDIQAVDLSNSFSDVFKLVLNSGFSRIPVYRNDIDHVEGILYAKDLLKFLDAGDDFKWQKLVRPPFFVPEYKKIEDLLKEFQAKRIHLAIVVDEYGGTSGIVTLEDIMEEIIGEIKDEFDDPEEIEYEKIDDQQFIFEGKTLIQDFCKVMDVRPEIFDEVKGESDSLAGLLLEITQKMPSRSERINYRNFRFEVLSVSKKRIQKVKITILDESEISEEV